MPSLKGRLRRRYLDLDAAYEAFMSGDWSEGEAHAARRRTMEECWRALCQEAEAAGLVTPPGAFDRAGLAAWWLGLEAAWLRVHSRKGKRPLPSSESCFSLRRVGEVWHLRFSEEGSDFPVKGNKFLGWLAKLLAKPNHAWSMAELLGDPKGKLKADAHLGGEYAKDLESLRKIKERIDEIDETTSRTGGSERLEKERDQLLLQVRRHSARERMPAAVTKPYNNFAVQKSQFLVKLQQDMPQLAAHLKACLVPSASDYTISYRLPAGTPLWDVENPTN
jgi:hypothetical protein